MENITLISKDNNIKNLMRKYLGNNLQVFSSYNEIISNFETLLYSTNFVDYDSLGDDKLLIMEFISSEVFTKDNVVFITSGNFQNFITITKDDFIANYLTVLKNERQYDNIYAQKLIKTGIKANSLCFHYLMELIKTIHNNPNKNLKNNIMQLYKLVSEKFNRPLSAIEKCIRQGILEANLNSTITNFINSILEN